MQNMAERLAENSHDIWAKKKKEELNHMGRYCCVFSTMVILSVDVCSILVMPINICKNGGKLFNV